MQPRAKLGSFSKWIKIGIVSLFLINFSSCNFPEDLGQERLLNTPFVYHFETGSTGGTVNYNFDQNLRYQVVLAPKWLKIESIEGRTVNGEMIIPFEFYNIQDYLGQNNYISGALMVRIGNIGLFSFTVSYGEEGGTNPDPDHPILVCNVANLNFVSEESLSFTLTNSGVYDNSWYASDIPWWLQLSETNGYVSGGKQITIQCTLKKDALAVGDYSQIINIVSSNPPASHEILVSMKVDNAGTAFNQPNMKWIEGKVKDAYLCKSTNYMYILTQKPNQLLYKLPNSDSLYAVPLSLAPNCIDVSKDGKTLVIGYNQAVVDLFDAQTFELKRSYELNCVPFDIVLGENDWCYITPDVDQWVRLHNLNLNTGITGASGSIYEKAIMVKAPDKPLLYATTPPSGLSVVDISQGFAKDTIAFWHQETGSAIWVSHDGKKLITGGKKLFKTPDYTASFFNADLPLIGSVDIPSNYIISLDFCEALNSYFVVGADYFWSSFNSETIYQIDAVSYTETKSVKVQPYPNYVANTSNKLMDVHHVFTNNQGTKLFAVKNLSYEAQTNKWALEIIDLPLK